MSKYTAEQVRERLQEMHGHALTVAERAELFSMASNYAALLRERESAKVAVTERCPHGVRYPHPCRECEDSAPMPDDLYRAALAVSARIFCWRTTGAQPTYSEWMELEEKIDKAILSYTPKAVAPMLASDPYPIPMILHCPSCHAQHIDNDASVRPDGRESRWNNPPHRSHLCHNCGSIWRPADVPTTGVERIQTQGKNDAVMPTPVLVSARVPDGWKLVPVDPTGEMIDQGTDQHECEQGDTWYKNQQLSEGDCIAIYKAMLAAAPKPEKE